MSKFVICRALKYFTPNKKRTGVWGEGAQWNSIVTILLPPWWRMPRNQQNRPCKTWLFRNVCRGRWRCHRAYLWDYQSCICFNRGTRVELYMVDMQKGRWRSIYPCSSTCNNKDKFTLKTKKSMGRRKKVYRYLLSPHNGCKAGYIIHERQWWKMANVFYL